ncbi:unnamed protein product [Trichobilharzia szidati]|nr:unnamed protein product [Trichobilharzia szidati]
MSQSKSKRPSSSSSLSQAPLLLMPSAVSSTSSSSLSTSSCHRIYGFVQCVSQKFKIKSKYHVLIKITSCAADCFCLPVHNILVQWGLNFIGTKVAEECNKFIRTCRLRQWVCIYQLKEYRIYHEKNREKKIWLFIPNESYAEVCPTTPEIISHMSCSQSLLCPKLPTGLITSIHLHLLQIHDDGMFMFKDTTTTNTMGSSNYSSYEIYYLLLNFENFLFLSLSEILSALGKIETIQILNVWCYFIGYEDVRDEEDETTSNGRSRRRRRLRRRLYAILIPGIYSSSIIHKSNQISTKTSLPIDSYLHTPICQSKYCHQDDQFDRKRLSLLVHNLQYIHDISIKCQATGLKNETLLSKINKSYYQKGRKEKECELPQIYQRLRSVLFKHSLKNISTNTTCTTDKSYQYTEDFIEFPFNTMYDKLKSNDYCYNLSELMSIVSLIDSPLTNTKDKLCKILSVNKCVSYALSIHSGEIVNIGTTTMTSSLSPEEEEEWQYQYSWNIEIHKKILSFNVDNKTTEHYHVLKRLTCGNQTIPFKQSDNLMVKYLKSFLIGPISWNHNDSCFHIHATEGVIFSNLFATTNYCNSSKGIYTDKNISLPIILDMNTTSGMLSLNMLTDNSIVLLKDVQLIVDEEYSPTELCRNRETRLNDPQSLPMIRRIYIYAKDIIPLQINYTRENIILGENDTHDYQSSMILLHLSQLSTSTLSEIINNNASSSVIPEEIQIPLCSYVFTGKSINHTNDPDHNHDPNTIIHHHLTFTGSLAYRWYSNFHIGKEYHLTWRRVPTAFGTPSPPMSSSQSSEIYQLTNVSVMIHQSNISMIVDDDDNDDEEEREENAAIHCIKLNDILNSPPKKIDSMFNFEGVLLFKSYCTLNKVWTVWMTDKLLKLNNNNDNKEDIYECGIVHQIQISNNNNNINNNHDHLKKFLMHNPGEILPNYYKFVNFILTPPVSSTSMLLYCINVMCTPSSRIIMNESEHYVLFKDVNNDTLFLDMMNISLVEEEKNNTESLMPIVENSNHFDWINNGGAGGGGGDHGSVTKECITVQATILRCLEFQIYRSPNINENETSPNFGICLRFIISDGSGSALVQLGNHPASTVTGVVTPPHRPTSKLARLLLGFNVSIWKKLCYQLNCLLLSSTTPISLYDVLNNNNITPHEYTTFNSSINDVVIHRKDFLSSIKQALKVYLESPAFLRNCRFTLKKRQQPVRNIPSRYLQRCTPSSTSVASSSERWRLKRINVTNGCDSATSNNDGDQHQQQHQSVYFVLPPYKLYTLINVTSHNDDVILK